MKETELLRPKISFRVIHLQPNIFLWIVGYHYYPLFNTILYFLILLFINLGVEGWFGQVSLCVVLAVLELGLCPRLASSSDPPASASQGLELVP